MCGCLQLPTKFGPNGTELWRHIYYPRWRHRNRNSTSGFVFRWLRSFGKVEICLQTKFRRDISIHGWDSGFWKHTSAMLEFYFRFRFSRLCHHRHVILHLPAKFWQKLHHPWHNYDVICIFQDGGRQSYWLFSSVTADHPRSANEALRLIFKFRLDRIYSFGDIAIFMLWCFALKLPVYVIIFAAHAQNLGSIYFRGRNWPHILICSGRLPIQHPTSKGVAGRFKSV